jgi:hypothetical protein
MDGQRRCRLSAFVPMAAMAIITAQVLVQPGCITLDEGDFTRLDDGWACAPRSYELTPEQEIEGLCCESVEYHAYNNVESIRLDIRYRTEPYGREEGPESGDVLLPLSGEHTVRVYTGAALVHDAGENKCDDMIDAVGLSSAMFRIDHVYEAVEGDVTLRFEGDPVDEVSAHLSNVVFQQNDDLESGVEGSRNTLPDVLVEDVALPAFALAS